MTTAITSRQIDVQAAGAKAVMLLVKGLMAGDRPLLVVVNLGETASIDLSEIESTASRWELVLDTEAGAYGGATATRRHTYG